MKKLLFFTAILFSAMAGLAQASGNVSGFKFGAGITVDFPVNNLRSTSIGAGIDLMARYGIDHNMAITGDAGYTALFQKEEYGTETFNLIPIRLGVRYYPTHNIFVAAKIGAGFLSSKGSDGSTTYTAYSFGAGYAMSDNLDVGLSYDGYTRKAGSFGLIALRLGLLF